LRDREEPLRAFRHEGSPARNHFEFTMPWSGPSVGERAVIISPGNITPSARCAAWLAWSRPTDGAAPFRSNSYLFLAEGPNE
jgi:hypothetical protein